MKKTCFWEEAVHPAWSIEEIKRVLKYFWHLWRREKTHLLFSVFWKLLHWFSAMVYHISWSFILYDLSPFCLKVLMKSCVKNKCTFNLGLNERLESSMKLNFSTYIVLYHVLNNFPNWKYWRLNWECYFYLLYCIPWTSGHSTGSGLEVSRLKSTLSWKWEWKWEASRKLYKTGLKKYCQLDFLLQKPFVAL